MSTADFPGVRWRGHWVAPDVPEFVIDPTSVGSDLPPAELSRAQFRRVFDIEDVPPRVPLRLSADSRYVLWVNGAEVGRGPIRSQPRRLRYDEYDIAAYLRPGRNVVAVLVTYYGHANSFWQPAASSGLMGRDAQLVVEARVGEEWLVTDERWRVLRLDALDAIARRALDEARHPALLLVDGTFAGGTRWTDHDLGPDWHSRPNSEAHAPPAGPTARAKRRFDRRRLWPPSAQRLPPRNPDRGSGSQPTCHAWLLR
jgi:hypothetical protein